MNKGKQPMPLNIRKKVEKQVKKDLKGGEDTPTKAISKKYPTEKEMLSTQPKKRAKSEKEHVVSMERAVARKKSKLAGKKRSKRTEPKDGIVGSQPAHVHPEGKRWMKTLAKQTKVQSKKIIRKATKRK